MKHVEQLHKLKSEIFNTLRQKNGEIVFFCLNDCAKCLPIEDNSANTFLAGRSNNVNSPFVGQFQHSSHACKKGKPYDTLTDVLWNGARITFTAQFLIVLIRVRTVNLTEIAIVFGVKL